MQWPDTGMAEDEEPEFRALTHWKCGKPPCNEPPKAGGHRLTAAYLGGRSAVPAPPVVVDVPDEPDVRGFPKLPEFAGGDPPRFEFTFELPLPALVPLKPVPRSCA